MANQRQGQMPRESQRLPNSRQRRSRERMNDFAATRAGQAGKWSYQAQQPGPQDPYVRQKNRPFPPEARQPDLPPRNGMNENTPVMPSPLYELPDMINLIPDQRYNYINYDYSGYITLCEASYKNLTKVEPRFTRQITLGTFIHVMNEYFWARLFRLSSLFCIRLPFEIEEMINLIGGKEVIIPSEIYEYLRNIGEFTDGFGNIWRPNIPDLLVPRPAYRIHPGGHFGVPAVANHNIYEICAAPYTTAERVRSEIAGLAQFQPLPNGIMPGLTPTENFVGFTNNVIPATPEALARLQNVHFDQDPLGSRVCHSPELRNTLDTALRAIENKARFSFGIPNNIEGSTSAIGFVQSNVPRDPLTIVRNAPISIMSRSQLTRSEIGQNDIFAYRRYRHDLTPGLSFLYRDEEDYFHAPPGWMDTINGSFNAEVPFQIRIGDENDLINNSAFQLNCAGDSRTTVVTTWVQNNFRR